MRGLRIQMGLSQASVSERTGVSKRTLIRWESGKARPRRAELDLVRSALGMADDMDARARWRRRLRFARGRLGLSHEAIGALLNVHGTTVRRVEEGQLGLTPDLARQRIRALPLHPSESDAFLSILGASHSSDWTNFDLHHDRLLARLEEGESDWWHATSDYARLLSEANRHEEAREWAISAVDSAGFGDAPKTVQFSVRCVLARTYFFDSWRSAQRGLSHLRKLKGLAVGRREICEREALLAECLGIHGRREPALEHARRAVSIAEGLGGSVLSARLTDYAAAQLRAENAEAALATLPAPDSEGAVEFVSRARLLSDIQRALGDIHRSEHWRELSDTVMERERLHGRFRLCRQTAQTPAVPN